MHAPRIPLFNRDELTAAFALIFRDPAVAHQVAGRWFEEMAGDDVDAEGRFLYRDWHEEAGMPLGEPDAFGAGSHPYDTPEAHEAEAASFRGWSDERKSELVLSFSSFHFDLVALVSPELFERMRAASGMTAEQAEVSRAQMERIARALRG